MPSTCSSTCTYMTLESAEEAAAACLPRPPPCPRGPRRKARLSRLGRPMQTASVPSETIRRHPVSKASPARHRGKDQIEVPVCHRHDLCLYTHEWPVAVCINALEIRLPWYRNGSDLVQFQSRAPGFIAGNVHIERLDLEMERAPQTCGCAPRWHPVQSAPLFAWLERK